jgi:hypothetical protein
MKKKTSSLPEEIDCTRGATGQNPIVWLVWFINDKNLVGIYSIASNNKFARNYRKLCLSQRGVVRSWIEKREIDHLFGSIDMISSFNLDRSQIHALAKEFPI